MRADAPDWWQSGAGPWPMLLAPVAALYGAGVTMRWRLARPARAALPVICVGNFTVGGMGKTPAALAVARLLRGLGERPAFLTRGYGGQVTGPHLVDPERDSAAYIGDEPLLLARAAPTVVCGDRAAGARHAAGLDVTVLVMDDGFQNLDIEKDLALIVVDARAGVGNGRVLPAGLLRAPLAFQIARADALIRIGDGTAADALATAMMAQDKPVFEAAVAPADDVSWLNGTRVVAFAGIARPEKFFSMLRDLGAVLADAVPFPDHHAFTPSNTTHRS